jgi:hypothetical protein
MEARETVKQGEEIQPQGTSIMVSSPTLRKARNNRDYMITVTGAHSLRHESEKGRRPTVIGRTHLQLV